MAIVPDQHIGRFNIAVNDEIAMRLAHRAQDVEEQVHPAIDVYSVFVAVFINMFSLDMLENEVGLSFRRNSGVNQFCNVRVREPAEDGSFTLKAFDAQRTIYRLIVSGGVDSELSLISTEKPRRLRHRK